MSKSFRDLEGSEAAMYSGCDSRSSLSDWYMRVRNVPISQLGDGDLARATRQLLQLHYVVPIACARVKANPLAGEMYDGELFAAISKLDVKVFRDIPVVLQQIRTLLTHFENSKGVPEEIQEDVRLLKGSVEKAG